MLFLVISTDAIVKRLLQAGVAPLETLFTQFEQWLPRLPSTCDLPWHSLLLFDLGYFSFPCFDSLTERGYWWISRLREKTGYQLLHVHYRHHEILDALVWLGSGHGSRAGGPPLADLA